MSEQKAASQTPEFQQAVKEAVAALLPDLESAIAKRLNTAISKVAPAGQPDQDLFRQMALAIAEISDQGTNRKRVAPEVLEQRAKAHGRMTAILREVRDHLKVARETRDEAAIISWTPRYRLVAKQYLNEIVINPYTRLLDKTTKPTEIGWTGVPNEGMRPVNAVAERIFKEYSASIATTEKIKGVLENFWVSANGLTINGAAPASVRSDALNQPAAPFREDLEMGDPNDPSAPYIRVLGKTAPPARQNFAGEHRKEAV